jgi:hypothetical protein
VKDVASANAAAPTLKEATTKLKAPKPLWDQIPSQQRPALIASLDKLREAHETISTKLSGWSGIDPTVLQAFADYIAALKSF